jgi:hypothetical protein
LLLHGVWLIKSHKKSNKAGSGQSRRQRTRTIHLRPLLFGLPACNLCVRSFPCPDAAEFEILDQPCRGRESAGGANAAGRTHARGRTVGWLDRLSLAPLSLTFPPFPSLLWSLLGGYFFFFFRRRHAEAIGTTATRSQQQQQQHARSVDARTQEH